MYLASRIIIIYDMLGKWLPDLLLFEILSTLGPPKGSFFKHGIIILIPGLNSAWEAWVAWQLGQRSEIFSVV